MRLEPPIRSAIGRSLCTLAVLGTLITAACSDNVVPLAPHVTAQRKLSDGLKTWQCSTAAGVVAVEVAEGNDDPTAVTAPEGHVIAQIAIKVGSECWPTPAGTTGTFTIALGGMPCAVVEGLGTQTAIVTRIGTSPECRNVTHVEYVSMPVVATGFVRVCKAIALDTGGPVVLQIPFTYAVSGVTLTLGLAGAPAPLLMCADPIALPAGEYSITEAPKRTDVALAHVLSEPADRLVASDMTVPMAIVRVVAGSTTVVTFRALVDSDQND